MNSQIDKHVSGGLKGVEDSRRRPLPRGFFAASLCTLRRLSPADAMRAARIGSTVLTLNIVL